MKRKKPGWQSLQAQLYQAVGLPEGQGPEKLIVVVQQLVAQCRSAYTDGGNSTLVDCEDALEEALGRDDDLEWPELLEKVRELVAKAKP
jgi:hypothetical protein